MCFYHSIMDWHQPDAKAAKYPHQSTEHPDWAKYRDTYLKPQLKELITNYDPAVLWFDGEWIDEWTEPQGKELYAYLKSLKPSLIINNRIGKGRKGNEWNERLPKMQRVTLELRSKRSWRAHPTSIGSRA